MPPSASSSARASWTRPAGYPRRRKGCDIVFHVAAKAGVWGRHADFYRANVLGTRNVIAACRHHGIGRLVYTSSPSVVFNGRDMEGVDESVPYPTHFEASYPATKAEAEQLVLAANDATLATVALRPHLIWGPGDNHLVPRILARGRAGALRRIGDRPCLVDTIYIDNAAEAHLLAAERLVLGSVVAGRAYFLAQGEPKPLWEIVNRILAAGGLPPVSRSISAERAYMVGTWLERIYRLLRLSGEPRMTRFVARELSTAHWFDLSAARRDFGYAPRVTFDEGMRRLQHVACRRPANRDGIETMPPPLTHWGPPPGRPMLATGSVHLWRVRLAEDRGDHPQPLLNQEGSLILPSPLTSPAAAFLSADERARAMRLRLPAKAHEFIVGRARLRQILSRYLDRAPAELSFSYGPYGKPALAGADDLQFNLAHSGDWLLLGVTAGRSLGVDLECIDPELGYASLARRYFSPDEQDLVNRTPLNRRRRTFYRLWTRKEAYLKGRGGGFAESSTADVSSCDWHCRNLFIRRGYVAALAVPGSAGGDIQQWTWQEDAYSGV